MVVGWIVAALVLGLIELLTVDFFFLTLALASLVSGVFALLGVPLWGQIVIFGVVSVIFLLTLRPWAKKHLSKTTPNIDTNVRGLVGKSAIVTQALVGPAGRIRLEGEEWSARIQSPPEELPSAREASAFPVGSQVRVVAIEGATAIVGPLAESIPPPPDSVPPEANDK